MLLYKYRALAISSGEYSLWPEACFKETLPSDGEHPLLMQLVQESKLHYRILFRHLRAILEHDNLVVYAQVVSSCKIDSDDRNIIISHLKTKHQTKKALVKYYLDPSLIYGFSIRARGVCYEDSLRSTLENTLIH